MICRFLTAALLMMLCACRDMTAAAVRTAVHAGFAASIVQGATYQHATFARSDAPPGPLYVFIEGDGSPWTHQGTRVSDDPTPRRPLALILAAQTSGSVLYLGRPCYFQARNDAACTPPVWTSERYSARVVDSMAAVVNRRIAAKPPHRVVLIGYSGGGVLAVLMAPLIPGSAVVTIAANLDTDAWTRWHGYAALGGSLNPANRPPLDAHIQEWHLLGDRDEVVPPLLSQRYLDRISPSQVWHYAGFDHVCCWTQQWPDIFSRIAAAVRENDSR